MRADCCADHVDVDERWNGSERGRGMTQAAFLLFVFLKQFYIKSSGSIGIADLCIAFCVIFLVLDIVRGKRKMPSVTDLKREKFLIAFLICVVIINLFFTIKDRCLDYERYTLYWIFNGAAIWCFLELADKDFLKKLNGVCMQLWGPYGPHLLLSGCVFYEYIQIHGHFFRFDVVYSRNGDMVLCKI